MSSAFQQESDSKRLSKWYQTPAAHQHNISETPTSVAPTSPGPAIANANLGTYPIQAETGRHMQKVRTMSGIARPKALRRIGAIRIQKASHLGRGLRRGEKMRVLPYPYRAHTFALLCFFHISVPSSIVFLAVYLVWCLRAKQAEVLELLVTRLRT